MKSFLLPFALALATLPIASVLGLPTAEGSPAVRDATPMPMYVYSDPASTLYPTYAIYLYRIDGEPLFTMVEPANRTLLQELDKRGGPTFQAFSGSGCTGAAGNVDSVPEPPDDPRCINCQNRHSFRLGSVFTYVRYTFRLSQLHSFLRFALFIAGHSRRRVKLSLTVVPQVHEPL